MDPLILIIEDNDNDLLIIKRYLSKAGYNNIIDAGNVEDGVKRALEESPVLIITDTLLPDSDGFEACRLIRESSDDPDLKIIVTTGNLDAVDAVKARKAGADDYCAKTSDYEILLTAVKKLV